MNELQFVKAESPQQVQTLARLADETWHDAYKDLLAPEQIDYMVQNLQSEAAITRQIEQEGYLYYILQCEGAAAGYLGVAAKDGGLLLSKIYLLADWRGKHLSGPIFAFAEDLARSLGCNRLWLTVNRHNANAVRAYERNGLHCVREQVADIGGGFVMDDFVMEKVLQE